MLDAACAIRLNDTMTDRTYRSYLLGLLLLVLAFNLVDRLALGLLLQHIKADLDLSDTQLGVLGGISFAIFYSIMGIPMARWADQGNRVAMIAVTVAMWSAAVALCGVAGSFLQLILIRVFVAVGEAGCIPPAHSLIADHFSRSERPRAVAIYMLGAPLSMVLAYSVAGWLNEAFGWRVTFALLGLPGLALALLVWLTLIEPRNRDQGVRPATWLDKTSSARSYVAQPRGGMKEAWSEIWKIATFRHLLFAFSVVAFFGSGILQWQPIFFIRSFGLETGELGVWFALIWGVGGLLGTYVGGELASRAAAKNERLQLAAMALAYCSFGVISTGIYLTTDPYVAFTLMALSAVGLATATGPMFATIQSLVRPNLRAMAVAMLYLFSNLIGMGLGPLAVGALSDLLSPAFGNESIRYGLLILCPGYLWGAWHLWKGSTTVAADLEAVQRGAPADVAETMGSTIAS